MTKPIEQMAVEYVLLLFTPDLGMVRIDKLNRLRNKMIDDYGSDQYDLHVQNAENTLRLVLTK